MTSSHFAFDWLREGRLSIRLARIESMMAETSNTGAKQAVFNEMGKTTKDLGIRLFDPALGRLPFVAT